MNTITDKRVFKDVDKLPKHIQGKTAQELENLKNATNLGELSNIRRMEGTNEPYYRLKFDKYRILLYHDIETDTVEIISISHRKDSYKKQNLPWLR